MTNIRYDSPLEAQVEVNRKLLECCMALKEQTEKHEYEIAHLYVLLTKHLTSVSHD